MYHHSRYAFNVLNMLSSFGGILSAILNTFAVIGVFCNSQLFYANLIGHLYFVKLDSNKTMCNNLNNRLNPLTGKLHDIEFNIADKFYFANAARCCRRGRRTHNSSSKVFEKGTELMDYHMDISNILEAMAKIKAGLAAVIDNN